MLQYRNTALIVRRPSSIIKKQEKKQFSKGLLGNCFSLLFFNRNAENKFSIAKT
ncbi:hypothetical protein PI172_0288 [Prevotella intermedia]|uniref:Uncharacterized protein n=1 Tax=Prevotella intermedia TaxID=28131 RepID=A0AAD1F6M0_PREIN|nr:hypothetical protein PIN17_A0470 [Prevotella intermedia 17]BAR95016.1 hypothetical protein PI172_0288 [Prevotella intermedia]